MRRQPGIATTTNAGLTILSVSPSEEDHLSVQAIVDHSTWTLFKADCAPLALPLLQEHDISVVVCESDVMPRTWIEILEHTHSLPHPPSLIVTSRLADERFWVEALNLGVWDVLAKPFNRSEIFRSVKAAWDHWHYQIETVAKPLLTMKTAS